MKIRLWSWLRRAQGYARLTIPYAGRGWITVDERCFVQREILTQGYYEPEVWEALAARAVAREVVWDVGAHIGGLSIRALLDSRVEKVCAFEPDSVQGEALQWNLSLNSARHAFHGFALGGRNTVEKLHRGPIENTGLSSLIGFSGSGAYDVECRTADDLIYREGWTSPTLLKIDVEGWEYQVLQGASRLFSENPPKALVIEAVCGKDGMIEAPDVVRFLSEKGYELVRVPRPSGRIEARENYLAVPR